MGFIEGVDRQQSILFPERVDDYIREDNPVRFIDAYAQKLDMVALKLTHAVPSETGREPYDPRDLVRLYLYGYMNRTRSSRELEKATYRNIEVFWLLRKLHPDHKTIADFRKDNGAALKQLCRDFTMLCKKLGMFGGDEVAIDGSKFSASNHNSRVYTKGKLRKIVAEIDEKIAAYFTRLDQADRVDDEEEKKDKDINPKGLNDHIAKLEKHKREVEQIMRALDESGQKQIALTDPDSRLMVTSQKGRDASYNVQIAVDEKHKLIVEHEVTNDRNDESQLYAMAKKAKETLGVDRLEVSADAGYFNKAEIKRCQDEQITCYVPERNSSQNRRLGLFTDKDFQYDQRGNCYSCPGRSMLTYRFQAMKEGAVVKVYEGVGCRTCLVRAKCTRSRHQNRRLYRWIHQEAIEEMHQRMIEQPEKVKKRGQLAEHPFGTIKRWMNHSYFLMRGKEKVATEMSLAVLSYNMKRVLKILGVRELIEAIGDGGLQKRVLV